MVSIAKQSGNVGEAVAVRYLRSVGYRIVDRNYELYGVGEIDIIAEKNGLIHCIEVKTSLTYGLSSKFHPRIHVTREKIERLVTVMTHYMRNRAIRLPRCISLMNIALNNQSYTAEIELRENVYIDSI